MIVAAPFITDQSGNNSAVISSGMERGPYIVWFGLYAVSGVSFPIEADSSRGAVGWYRK